MQQIKRNYDQIKADAQVIVNTEMERIKSDPELCKSWGWRIISRSIMTRYKFHIIIQCIPIQTS